MKYFEILQEKELTDTDSFKHWFGDSKVVDASGRPLRMYHGTSHAHIQKFEVGYNSYGTKEFAGNHKVVSFTTDPAFAERYAGSVSPEQYGMGRKPTIYPVYIRSINPGDFRNPEHCKMVEQYRHDAWKAFIDRVSSDSRYAHIWTPEAIAGDLAKEKLSWDREIPNGSWQFWESPKLWEKMGWDGAWCREDSFHHHNNVLNFAIANSNQVKSAVGNKGAFDPGNPNIIEGIDHDPNNE